MGTLGAALGVASLDVLEEERLAERARELGARLAERLAAIPCRRRVETRGKGLL